MKVRIFHQSINPSVPAIIVVAEDAIELDKDEWFKKILPNFVENTYLTLESKHGYTIIPWHQVIRIEIIDDESPLG